MKININSRTFRKLKRLAQERDVSPEELVKRLIEHILNNNNDA